MKIRLFRYRTIFLSLILLSVFLASGCKSKSTSPAAPAPDTTPPTIVSASRTPVPSTTNIPINNTTISVNFNEEMDPASTEASISLKKVGSTVLVPGTPSYDVINQKLTFKPNSDLLGTTPYLVEIQGAKDKALNGMTPTTEAWTFTTGATPDLEAPTFTGGDPSLIVTPTSTTTIRLQWDPAADDITAPANISYAICRLLLTPEAPSENCTDLPSGNVAFPGAGASNTISTSPGVTTFQVTGLLKSKTYKFAVRAIDLSGKISQNTLGVQPGTTFGDFTSLGTVGSLNNAPSNRDASNPSVTVVDTIVGSKPYIAWEEQAFADASLSTVYVKSFLSGAQVSFAEIVGGRQPRIASDRSSVPIPYITYTECDSTDSNCKILVKKEVTTAAWQSVPSAGENLNVNAISGLPNTAGDSDIAFDGSNNPYVVWAENAGTAGTPRQIYVKQFDTTSGGTWVQVGPTATPSLNQDTAKDAMNPSIAIDGTLINVAWTECDLLTTANCKLYIKRWTTASSTSWVLVGPGALNVSATVPPESPSLTYISDGLTTPSNILHISWREGKAVIVKKEAAGNTLTTVDNPTPGLPASASLVSNAPIAGSTSGPDLFFVFGDDPAPPGNPDLLVRSWTGTSWVAEGTKLNMTGGSTTFGINSSIALSSTGKLVVAWVETGTCLAANCGATTSPVHFQIYAKELR